MTTSGARNEAAVREEIIAPILRLLGYRSGGPNDIRYEMNLAYPRDFLGRKKKTDPALRGKADYVCSAGGAVAWTVEAKPEWPISEDDLEQSYTYAKHPEVRGVYFCVCNGIEFRVYDTNAEPRAGPLRIVDCGDIERASRELKSLLAPEALLARHFVAAADARPPIGKDLGSFVQVVGGCIVHEENTMNLAALRGMTISVTGGAIQRVDGGSLLGYFESRAPYSRIQDVINRLGLTRVEAYSTSSVLSDDAAVPTTFQTGPMSAVFPEGIAMFDLVTHGEVILPTALGADVSFMAVGVLRGHCFEGRFDVSCAYTNLSGRTPQPVGQFISRGRFEFLLK